MGAATTGASDVADAGLNVVPFIDLLICLICFLVVSAAWTSLTRIDVDQALPKTRSAETPPPPDKRATLQVAITAEGFAVNVANGPDELRAATRLPTHGEVDLCAVSDQPNARCPAHGAERYKRYDHTALRLTLSSLMAKKGVGRHARVMVAAADTVPYLHLIATLDSVLSSCVGEGGDRRCLVDPTVGDIALLRGLGQAFDAARPAP